MNKGNGEIYSDKERNVYYNIRIENEEENFKVANFSSSRVQNILSNPNEYELAVVRFSVPSYNIPVYFLEEKLEVGMDIEVNGKLVKVIKDLDYIQKYNPELYGKPTIWNYNTIIDMINAAYEQLLPELKEAVEDEKETWPVEIDEDKPVIFSFDPSTRLISYYSPTSWTNVGGSQRLGFYCNPALQRLFPTFDFLYNEAGEEQEVFYYQFEPNDRIINRVNFNGEDTYFMTQDSPTLYLWSPLKSIQFKTQKIPINPEFLPTTNNSLARLITDFQAPEDDPSRQPIQFFPQGPLRYYDLKSNYGLRDIDLIVEWEDWCGNVYPLYISKRDVLTCKLLFRRKIAEILEDIKEDN